MYFDADLRLACVGCFVEAGFYDFVPFFGLNLFFVVDCFLVLLAFSLLIEMWERLAMPGSKLLLFERAPVAKACAPPVAQNCCLAAVVVTAPACRPREN